MKPDTRLARLREAEKNLGYVQTQEFSAMFIGALSSLVSDKSWDEALSAASRCIAVRYPDLADKSKGVRGEIRTD